MFSTHQFAHLRGDLLWWLLTGEAIHSPVWACSRKHEEQKDLQKVTAYRQIRKNSWHLKGQHQGSQIMRSLQYSHATSGLVFDLQHFCLEIARTLPAQLLRPLIGSLSAWDRSQHRCLGFMHIRFHAAVSHGAAVPALLPLADWHSCCALQVSPAKAMKIWLLTLTRTWRGPCWPSWLQIMAKIFGLAVISLCK